MKKVVKYKVSGMSNTKPDVSKDFTVEEIVTEVPMDDLKVASIKGNPMEVREVTNDGTITARFDGGWGHRHFDVDASIKIRDWLNEFIETNSPKLKVFRDRDNGNYRWFELPNGNYTFCRTRSDADQEYANDKTVGQTFSWLVDAYGPLTLDLTK